MELSYEVFDQGIAVSLDGKQARITWPEEIWRPFPGKDEFATELVFLMTSGLALGRADASIRYGFPRPRFVLLRLWVRQE